MELEHTKEIPFDVKITFKTCIGINVLYANPEIKDERNSSKCLSIRYYCP
jgi:hypothetical protein